MNKATLKDGTEATIEIWDNNQLEDWLNMGHETYTTEGTLKIRGFEYLQLSEVRDRRVSRGNIYSQENNLSPLEIQSERKLEKDAYDRSIVGLVDEELAGIWIFNWIKTWNFWNYYSKFFDVRKDYKNNGLATILIKTLNQAEFIKGKIVQIGNYSPEGRKYLCHLINREMKAEDYARILKGDCPFQAPTEFGVYGSQENEDLRYL